MSAVCPLQERACPHHIPGFRHRLRHRMRAMALRSDNPRTEAAVRSLAALLGTDDASVIDPLVIEAYEALESATSYGERRNARVRLRALTERAQAAAAAARD